MNEMDSESLSNPIFQSDMSVNPPPKTGAPLRRSCEVCRASKSRCVVDEGSRRYQRCTRDGKQCVFAEARPRPKKIKTSKTRVAEMEQKLDGIFALLASANKPREDSTSVPSESHSSGSSIQTPEQPKVPEGTIPGSCGITNDRLVDGWQHEGLNCRTPSSKTPPTDIMKDVIGRGVVSSQDAERLVRSFRAFAYRAPFVLLPDTNLDTLRREKPFTLLNALAMAAHTNMHLQEQLEREIRESLSHKMIFTGEKSLDLLQGLLLYLTWYQYYFRPERENIYQLSQMAVSLAVELEITKPKKSVHPHIPYTTFDTFTDIQQATVFDFEEKRTFLGVYYLTSCLAIAFRKPSHLRYNDYVEECRKLVQENAQTPSDRQIPYLVELLRLGQDINDTFDYDHHQGLTPLGAGRIALLLKTFNNRLNELEMTFPFNVPPNIGLLCRLLRIYINEIGFHDRNGSMKEPNAEQSARQEWFSTPARTETLITCLEAAKAYFDYYLSLSLNDIKNATMLDAVGLVYAVLILSKFSSGTHAPNMAPSDWRKNTNMSFYLDAAKSRLNALITIENGQEKTDYLWHFRRLFGVIKLWHDDLLINDRYEDNDPCQPGSNHLAFLKILELQKQKDIEVYGSTRFVPVSPEPPVTEQAWSDLVNAWSPSMDPNDMLILPFTPSL